jgi:hypothetical protein
VAEHEAATLSPAGGTDATSHLANAVRSRGQCRAKSSLEVQLTLVALREVNHAWSATEILSHTPGQNLRTDIG